jgi:REP element-mobilizing transposase RayT
MPNHFHGILTITEAGRGTARRAPQLEGFARPVSGSVPTIVRAFKSAVTKRWNELLEAPQTGVWQRNYFEHIIRDEEDLDRIREYIDNNPATWEEDRENLGGKTLNEIYRHWYGKIGP